MEGHITVGGYGGGRRWQHTRAGWLTSVQNGRESVKIGTSRRGGCVGGGVRGEAVLMRDDITAHSLRSPNFPPGSCAVLVRSRVQGWGKGQSCAEGRYRSPQPLLPPGSRAVLVRSRTPAQHLTPRNKVVSVHRKVADGAQFFGKRSMLSVGRNNPLHGYSSSGTPYDVHMI